MEEVTRARFSFLTNSYEVLGHFYRHSLPRVCREPVAYLFGSRFIRNATWWCIFEPRSGFRC